MSQKIFVATGANKGIGYGIVRGLAEKLSATIYLTSRNVSLGQDALKKVNTELGAKNLSNIRFHQLDITSDISCKSFVNYLKKEHEGIDVLINNAGVAYKSDTIESAYVNIGTNYYGTKTVSKHLVPLIHSGGRLVNVCSRSGIMTNIYSDKHINKFKSSNYTEADIDSFVEDYKKAAKEDNRKEKGYPESVEYQSYRVSKTAEIAFSLLQSAQLRPKNIIVNACCPGSVATDMTSNKGDLTISEGADTPIYLATDPNPPNGKFIAKREIKEWL